MGSYINPNRILIELMKEIYGTYTIDWMNYIVTRQNPLTFHHIKPEREGGLKVIQNGALITRNAHKDLNKLEIKDIILFGEWQALFKYINDLNAPLDKYAKETSASLRKYTKKILYK